VSEPNPAVPVEHAPHVATTQGHGVRFFDVLRLLLTWGLTFLSLLLTAKLLPGFTYTSWLPLAAAAAVAGVVGMIVRPVLVEVAAAIGWLAVAAATLFGQAIVMQIAMDIVPGASFDSFWTAVAAAWLTAAFSTLLVWLVSAGTDESFAASLLRIKPGQVSDPDVDGVVFVQLDGVAFPVLRWAIQAGAVPTLRRWVTSRDYVLREWTAQLPCTTPASQLGILHGTVAGVPAFRWYDRELGRVLIANRPDDASIIERRATTGTGLLADDGLSVGNLFTGDAPRAVLTMSRLGSGRGSSIARQTFAWFLTNPNGFTRGVVRTVAEVAKERWQAARQNRLNVLPRVQRGWTFAGLRAATNVLQRDLNTAVVAEEMRKGTKSIYVDYVDYDEVAHHAGMFRPEAMAALDGLDRVLKTLERLSTHAARRYHIVVLSDHGQSQGQTFRDRFGADLGEVCTRLMEENVASLDAPVEDWGRVDSLAEDLAGTGITGRAARRAATVSSRRVDQGAEAGTAAVSVLGSGNLGLLYVHSDVRLTLDDLQERWPDLIPGLCGHEGIGVLAGLDSSGVPWALGAQGRARLDTGVVIGQDPLRPYGDHAARVLGRAVVMPEAPDLYVISRVEDVTFDIAAFEPLVGAHGGLGGWQDRAVLLTPRKFIDLLPADTSRVPIASTRC